jgi:L-fuculose-phosphate aldolase
MQDRHLIEEIRHVSLSMFRKNFFGVYHGSISARIEEDHFLINTREAIFDEMTPESLIRLEIDHDDYRWSLASMDAPIHEAIYRQVPHAKYIAYAMPPYISAYALKHDTFEAVDYFGYRFFGRLEIHDAQPFHDWYARAPHAIANYFASRTDPIMLIRGYGIYAYDRSLIELAKKIAVLENSARLLLI